MKKLFSITPDVLGAGKVIFEWNSKGTLLAASGPKRRVVIFDRSGRTLEEIVLPPAEWQIDARASSCTHLQWDPAGDLLAILSAGCSTVFIWSSLSQDLLKIDADFKSQELTTMAWSKNGQYLAVGTSKGNLLIYNTREKKKTPFVAKHTRRIVSAVWNKDNVLGLCSADRMASWTDGVNGQEIKNVMLKGDPMELSVSDQKEDGYARREENTYTMILNQRVLHLHQLLPEGDRELDLEFQGQYGSIQRHLWFGDGYILLGFSAGWIVIVSSHHREVSQEAHSGKYLDTLMDVAYCPALGRIAMGGANSVRVVDTAGGDFSELKSDAIDLEPNQSLQKLQWTRDGQVLTVSTQCGNLINYLASLPVVFDHFGQRMVYLTSLLEMAVMDVQRRVPISKIELEAEPAFVGLGPNHAAAGINNQVWYYQVDRGTSNMISKREYLGSVSSVKLSESYAAVLSGGGVVLHPVGAAAGDADVVVAAAGSQAAVECVALTNHFVITGSKTGILSYYLVPSATPVNEYRHEEGGACAIVRLYPQPSPGTRLVFEDARGGLYLFNPVNDHCIKLQDATPVAADGASRVMVMWDAEDADVFVVADGGYAFVYAYVTCSLEGSRVQLVTKQALPSSHTPLLFANGAISCRLRSGAMDTVQLDSHRALIGADAVGAQALGIRFSQALKLFRLRTAYDCALQLRQPDRWRALATAALEVLDVPMAINAFRQLGDPSMVLSLERLKGVEDRSLLTGHLLVLLERDPAQAQEMFLRSSNPRAALDMRMDLKNWAEALRLAEQHAPEHVPRICKEHGASLEMAGEYASAKGHFQQALDALAMATATGETAPQPELETACRCGIARSTLQLGDLRQGRLMAIQIDKQELYKECAAILEGMQQLTESAEMYERAGQLERAATIYIQTKNFAAATPLMARVSSTKLQLQFAKAKEAEGRYAEAAAAYEAAGDVNAVVRLCLERLNAPQRAYAAVRKSQSQEAAKALAKRCLQTKDFAGAVEFLLLAQQLDQAFDIAQGHGEMDAFARFLENSSCSKDYLRIAQYYESRGENEKAGDMYVKCDQPSQAVKLFLKVAQANASAAAAGVAPSALDKAVNVVELTRNERLSLAVLDFVNDSLDGLLRDEYRFKLNIALGLYADAALDAMSLAQLEQEAGNYRVAHDKLFATVRQLENLGTQPPIELRRALTLLHSYTLVKSLIAVDDHITAARMLVRVARSISKFPKHVVQILTSTVIECRRAGMRKTAFEYASMLMRPEYRDQVNPKYKKHIELMVRKPEKDPEELPERESPCPFCQAPGPETDLQCADCLNIIPLDVATGKRMSLLDWAECPSCKFPANAQPFLRILAAETRCPMCNDLIDVKLVAKVQNPLARYRTKRDDEAGATSGGTAGASAGGTGSSSGTGNAGSGSKGGAPALSGIAAVAAAAAGL